VRGTEVVGLHARYNKKMCHLSIRKQGTKAGFLKYVNSLRRRVNPSIINETDGS